MPKRIHVVGTSPRTGTTLMVELLVASYRIDGHADHEMSVFERPKPEYRIFCSKLPGDLLNVGPLLRVDKNLWVINMVRDPRDVVVSRHHKEPDKYWVHLGVWTRRRKVAKRLASHPRFLNIRYEDLVRSPERVQQQLETRIPFLERVASFADFHNIATPSDRAVQALGGIRAIDTKSIGNWRNHKARLAAQLAIHGPIDNDLIDFSYEEDNAWLGELAGVLPDNGDSHFPEHKSLFSRQREWTRRYVRTLRYLSELRRETQG